MEDSYLTQRWKRGENKSLLRRTIFICIPSEISWEMGSPLLRRSFMRVERIAGICTGLARGGKKASWPVPVRCIGRQNWWLELVAKLGGKNRWQEPIQNRWLVAGANSGHQLYLATRIGGQVHPSWPGRDLWPVKLPPIALVS